MAKSNPQEKCNVRHRKYCDCVKKNAKMPDGVVDTEFSLDIDAQGYPAADIYVILRDDVANEDWLRANAHDIRQAIRKEFAQASIEQWPYIVFRSESEVAELRAAEGKK